MGGPPFIIILHPWARVIITPSAASWFSELGLAGFGY
jgi:hypothetical protein